MKNYTAIANHINVVLLTLAKVLVTQYLDNNIRATA